MPCILTLGYKIIQFRIVIIISYSWLSSSLHHRVRTMNPSIFTCGSHPKNRLKMFLLVWSFYRLDLPWPFPNTLQKLRAGTWKLSPKLWKGKSSEPKPFMTLASKCVPVDASEIRLTSWAIYIYRTFVRIGINYQPQLVSRISEPSTVS